MNKKGNKQKLKKDIKIKEYYKIYIIKGFEMNAEYMLRKFKKCGNMYIDCLIGGIL